MKHYSLSEISSLDKLFRANLINSCTGYKSANLIGTKSPAGVTNLAIFSSVTHLGSSPPLLGFILRPTDVPRNTYDNLKSTGFFTVNHIHRKIISQAHQTSAKYDKAISEFEKTGLTEQYLHGFMAPYVAESQVKMGCSYVNEYPITENDTVFIIGRIEHLYFEEDIQMDDGWLDLEEAETVAINGLDAYSLPAIIDRFDYARPNKDTKSLLRTDLPTQKFPKNK